MGGGCGPEPSELDLSVARDNLAATTITCPDGKSYALFGGGYDGSYFNDVDVFECCDGTITRTQTLQLQNDRSNLAATTITCPDGKSYALFGGGYSFDGGDIYYNDVDVFECCDVTNNIQYKTTLQLQNARGYLAATTITCPDGKSYALFGGGYSGGITFYNDVDVFECCDVTNDIQYKTTLQLQNARGFLAATTITCPDGKSYALFGGGLGYDGGTTYYNDVDVFECCDVTNNIQYKTTLRLSSRRAELAATTFTDCCNKEYALFGGGKVGISSFSNTVDLFDCTDIS